MNCTAVGELLEMQHFTHQASKIRSQERKLRLQTLIQGIFFNIKLMKFIVDFTILQISGLSETSVSLRKTCLCVCVL